MAEKTPKVGDKIPIEKFHVSRLNVRADEPFGESEEDQKLIANLRRGKVVQPFKARPEEEGYGVVVGRRRFLAKKHLGTKSFVAGVDCLVQEMTDEEARKASLVENLEVLRRSMNPVTRAEKLGEIIAFSPSGLRGTARELGLPASTVSEYLKILELSSKMQSVLAKGLLAFSEGLAIARLKLGEELQDKLAEVLETEGIEAFKRELARVLAGKGKRGIPKGVYEIDRVIWDKRSREDMAYYETVKKVAESKGMKPPEYIKDFVVRHMDEIRSEIS